MILSCWRIIKMKKILLVMIAIIPSAVIANPKPKYEYLKKISTLKHEIVLPEGIMCYPLNDGGFENCEYFYLAGDGCNTCRSAARRADGGFIVDALTMCTLLSCINTESTFFIPYKKKYIIPGRDGGN